MLGHVVFKAQFISVTCPTDLANSWPIILRTVLMYILQVAFMILAYLTIKTALGTIPASFKLMPKSKRSYVFLG